MTTTTTITTARDTEPREHRAIADALYDLRAWQGTGVSALARSTATRRIVRDAAATLGWSEARTLDAINRLAAEDAR